MEAEFDRAKRRYGIPPRLCRAYQACSRGLVEDSRKYGPPTVTARSARIRSGGFPAEANFHAAFGRMGRAAKLAARTAMCTQARLRDGSVSCSQCAYRY